MDWSCVVKFRSIRTTIILWIVRLSWLENAVLTRKVGQTDVVFDVQSWFIRRNMHARLQVFVCSSYDLCHPGYRPDTHRDTETDKQTAFWPVYINSSKSLSNDVVSMVNEPRQQVSDQRRYPASIWQCQRGSLVQRRIEAWIHPTDAHVKRNVERRSWVNDGLIYEVAIANRTARRHIQWLASIKLPVH